MFIIKLFFVSKIKAPVILILTPYIVNIFKSNSLSKGHSAIVLFYHMIFQLNILYCFFI